jgi:mono/diheme cytochrome c family protein
MRRTSWSPWILVIGCLSFLVLPLIAQQPKVQQAAAPATSAASGEEMFKSYCASCHGPRGKGDGPAASAFKTAPSDLTMLAKKNSGKFPDDKVKTVLRNGVSPAHGSADMPVWGPVFSAVSQNTPQIVTLRISNLTDFIQSMQAK